MKVSRYLRTYERMGRKLAYEKFVLWNDEVIDTTKQQTYIELEERGTSRKEWYCNGRKPFQLF